MHLNCHPEYQLQAQFASYLIMIVTIILTLETGMKGECDIEWFNVMSIVMATGFVATDLEHMYMLTYNVRTRSKLGMIKDFFSNGYYSYRLLGHSSYVGGSILKVKTYKNIQIKKDTHELNVKRCTATNATQQIQSHVRGQATVVPILSGLEFACREYQS